jgi:signal transduction histidine kinase
VIGLQGPSPLSPDGAGLARLVAEAATVLRYDGGYCDVAPSALTEERERIAMELHDGVVQALFSVGLTLQAAELSAEVPAELRLRLADCSAAIDRAIADLRHYVFGLTADSTSGPDVGRLLRDAADMFRLASGVAITVEVNPEAAEAAAEARDHVVATAREALSNAVRHSRGGRVRLTLELAGPLVRLAVADNGRGFDPSTAEAGHGLVNLAARAEALGGTLDVASEANAGTVVTLCFPAGGR